MAEVSIQLRLTVMKPLSLASLPTPPKVNKPAGNGLWWIRCCLRAAGCMPATKSPHRIRHCTSPTISGVKTRRSQSPSTLPLVVLLSAIARFDASLPQKKKKKRRRRLGDWQRHRRPELHLAEIDVIRDLVSIERDARGLGADVPLERDRQPEVTSRPTRNHDETPRAVRVPEDDRGGVTPWRAWRGTGPCRWRRPESPTRCGATSMRTWLRARANPLPVLARKRLGLSNRRARTLRRTVREQGEVGIRDRDRHRGVDEVGPAQRGDQTVERAVAVANVPRPSWSPPARFRGPLPLAVGGVRLAGDRQRGRSLRPPSRAWLVPSRKATPRSCGYCRSCSGRKPGRRSCWRHNGGSAAPGRRAICDMFANWSENVA